MMVSEIGV